MCRFVRVSGIRPGKSGVFAIPDYLATERLIASVTAIVTMWLVTLSGHADRLGRTATEEGKAVVSPAAPGCIGFATRRALTRGADGMLRMEDGEEVSHGWNAASDVLRCSGGFPAATCEMVSGPRIVAPVDLPTHGAAPDDRKDGETLGNSTGYGSNWPNPGRLSDIAGIRNRPEDSCQFRSRKCVARSGIGSGLLRESRGALARYAGSGRRR